MYYILIRLEALLLSLQMREREAHPIKYID